MPADLAALWEAHCRHEFETRDVDATMATMVQRPYVNHVPTMTGGVGHDQLKRFYKYHFIGNNHPDTELVPLSRTVGVDQIVDEMLFKFTHTSEVDWMLPDVAPTGRRVEIPLVAIVTQLLSKSYLERRGESRWDASAGTVVVHRGPKWWSWALAVLALWGVVLIARLIVVAAFP